MRLHPDVAARDDGEHNPHEFVEVLTAFETLMQESDERSARGTTAPNAAARGSSTPKRRSSTGGTVIERERTLGDILCERLEEEPFAATEVWAEIVDRKLRVHESMLEALFRACGAKGGGGLHTALEILRDANGRGLLSASSKEACAIFIIKWCKEDASSFSRILAELEESEQARWIDLT
jgi:hypothetical protein